MSKIFVDQVDPKTGTSLTLGTSGDTVNIPSGVTLANAGTVTGLPASAITTGTIATARLGSGTASSSTFLRGDQTYAAIAAGGITHASQWRPTGDATGDINPIANVEQNDTALYGSLGAAMSVSSGNFTFPVTGYWLVNIIGGYFLNGDSAYNEISIQATANNSSYELKAYSGCLLQQTASAPGFGNASATFLFDITDLTNQKVRFCNNVTNNSATLMGGTNYNTGTMMTFVRLADT